MQKYSASGLAIAMMNEIEKLKKLQTHRGCCIYKMILRNRANKKIGYNYYNSTSATITRIKDHIQQRDERNLVAHQLSYVQQWGRTKREGIE